MVSFSLSKFKGILNKKQQVVKEVITISYEYTLYDAISRVRGTGKYITRSDGDLKSRIKKELLEHWPEAKNIQVFIKDTRRERHMIEV